MEVINLLSSVGGVVGVPAALFLAKMYWDLRATIKRVDKMEAANTQLQADLTQIKTDLAFIRGRLEGKI